MNYMFAAGAVHTGEQDTTDLASICEEEINIYCNTHQHTHTLTHKIHELNIKVERSYSPPSGPENHCSFRVAVQGSVLWFWALCIIGHPNQLFFSDITSPDNAETPRTLPFSSPQQK